MANTNRPRKHLTPAEYAEAKDKTLISRSRRGDQLAMGELITRHHARITSYAHLWAHNQQDCEDLTQESILQMMESIRSFTGHCQFTTWLYKVVATTAATHYRDHQRQHPLTLKDLIPPQPSYVEPFADIEATIDARTSLYNAMRDLPLHERKMVFYVDLVGMRPIDVARRQNINQGTVRSRRFRGLTDLRVHLEEERAAALI